jgi:hypothetical protein
VIKATEAQENQRIGKACHQKGREVFQERLDKKTNRLKYKE